MKPLIEQARATVARFGMFAGGGGVVVGLSGGADSCALLHFLRFELSLDVTACHLNHGLRGEEAERDERFCRELCADWGVPILVRREAVAGRPGSVEEAGREARYRFFEEACAATGARWIATAHTRSDNLETLLLNLTRGAGARGLCGIPPVRMMEDPKNPAAENETFASNSPRARLTPGLRPVGRPLIECSREQVEQYCREQGIRFVTDSSNLNPSYTRNKIRLFVVPVLREMNPAVEEAAARAIAILRDEDAFLAAQAADALAAAERADGWDAAALAALPPALGRRAVAQLLEQSGVNPDFALTERAREMLGAPFARWELGPGRFFTVRSGRAFIRKERPAVLPYAFALEPGESRDLGFGILRSVVYTGPREQISKNVQKNLLYLALDYDKIKSKLTARSKQPGDRAVFAGRGGGKTLKKAFGEAGLSAFQKSARPVLADEDGIVGVPGFGPDVRCAVSPQTRRILLVSWEPRGK